MRAALLLVVLGCVTTRRLPLEPSVVPAINESLRGRDATLVSEHRVLEVHDVRLEPPVMAFEAAGKPQRAPLAAVQSIRWLPEDGRRRGAVEGALIVGGLSLVAGFAAGMALAESCDPSRELCLIKPAFAGLLLGGLSLAGGAIIGTFAGWGIGHHEELRQ